MIKRPARIAQQNAGLGDTAGSDRTGRGQAADQFTEFLGGVSDPVTAHRHRQPTGSGRLRGRRQDPLRAASKIAPCGHSHQHLGAQRELNVGLWTGAACKIAIKAACAQTYQEYTLIDHVIYNGLNLEAIPFSPKPSKEAPLLFAGRIAPEKGVEEAIEIAAMAGHRLLIAGGIYDRSYYEERIEPKLEVAGDRVTYLGQLERLALWKIMGQSLGLLFPVEWDEPFGLVAVESMATGAPVIAFRRGALEEIIRHGETGFLVEEGERAYAAALVDDLFDIPRAYCREYVEANFALSEMIDAYERAYREAIKAHI